LESSPPGKTSDWHPVEVFTHQNTNWLRAEVSEYGAILASMKVLDRNGIVFSGLAKIGLLSKTPPSPEEKPPWRNW
tara:strand:- start:322 stop:549 length:228 start_codon:yes stop_codon:yes gene_type:complete